jgi:GTP-binding protein
MDIAKCLNRSKTKFGKFIEEYLFSRENIAVIILLLDIRHKPTENDRLMYDYIIRSGLPFIILANKADKIAPTKVEGVVRDLQKQINPIGDITMLPFSAEKRIYTEDVWNVIDEYINKK